MLSLSAALLAFAPVLASTMPLPPELKKDVVVVKASVVYVSTGKPKPITLKGHVVRDFRTGVRSDEGGGAGIAHGPRSLSAEWSQVRDGFSFRLAAEGTATPDLGTVACRWGYAKWSGDLWAGKQGVGLDVPGATTLACLVALAPDEEPWEFLLWVDRPTNILLPEFPSGGALVRGDVRYDVASTNAVASLGGIPSTRMTGTLFRRGDSPVAAVERMPGSIIMRSSLDTAERSLFVCVGAAILTYDRFTLAASFRP